MQNRRQDFKEKMIAWASGRYGQDKLSKHLVWFSVGMWLLSMFMMRTRWQLLPMTFGWLALVAATLRMFSRNIWARQKELAFYEKCTEKPRRYLKLQKNKWRDRKTHRYFKCRCGATLRVPKGKGEIVIKCPKCGAQLDKTT